jgi:hypothetical protein
MNNLNDSKKVVDAFNEQYGQSFIPSDYNNWLEGKYDGGFNITVEDFLGEDVFAETEELARTDAALRYKLGIGPRFAGGIDLGFVKW